MKHLHIAVGSGRRVARLLTVLLLLLVLGAAALPAVQAQGINMYVIFHSRGGNISEYSGHPAHFHVNRVSLGAGYGHEAHNRLCWSGRASEGTDYYVRSNSNIGFTLNGGCLSDTFAVGQYRQHYYIIAMDDSDVENTETVTVTMSEDSGNPFPSGYYFPSRYSRATFRIIDND